MLTLALFVSLYSPAVSLAVLSIELSFSFYSIGQYVFCVVCSNCRCVSHFSSIVGNSRVFTASALLWGKGFTFCTGNCHEEALSAVGQLDHCQCSMYSQMLIFN